jgi:DNA repair exonuclease SbcCD ATPase subunit/DNA repair exonuclease SbcCD nuclease subunit
MIKSRGISYHGNIKKIYHIADVHIRNLKRHEEYIEVFDRLYKYIIDTKTAESIIILAGDIVHAKTDMTPEVVEMTQTFLKTLSDILPTILIPGNHDANLNNPSRLDALSPIVNALNQPNLHYLKESGVWDMGGISFAHSSVFSESDEIISSKDVDGNYKIALYHGAVDEVKTEHGFEIKNKKVNVDSFDGYDLVLLGDIHVPNQSLNDSGTIKYCGSTIMQNHSEAKYAEHGILVWDIDTKESQFVPIHNDYGYITVDIDKGKILGNPNIPNKPRMRIRVKDTPQSALKKILSKIRVGRSVKEVSIQKIITDTKEFVGNSNIVLQNTRDVGFQNKLIEQFIADKYIIDDSQLELVLNINKDINKKLDASLGMKNVIWKPKTFEFSNMFSYGSGNVIDFTNMKGAYGVFAPNASGKSSLLDALSFCIFDKCSRTSKAANVLNYSKSTFSCKFNFELNGVDYFIERFGKKSPKRGTVKVDVDFYCIKEDGSVKSLNGEERRDTNSIIRQHVGSYDDFVLTAMSVQGNSSGFIQKSQKERKDLLAQFLDINIFEQLYNIANEEIREVVSLLKEYKKQNFTEKVSDAKDELIYSEGLLNEIKIELDGYKTQKLNIQSNIDNLIGELRLVDDELSNIDTLMDLKSNLESYIDEKVSDLESNEIKLSDISEQKRNLTKECKLYHLDDLKRKNTTYETYVNKLEDININIKDTETEIWHKHSHLEGIGSLSFDVNCKHCIVNKNTPFAKQSKTLSIDIDNLNEQKSALTCELDTLNGELFKYDVRTQLEEVKILKDKIHNLDNKIDKLQLSGKSYQLELDNLHHKLDKTIEDIEKSIKQKESVEHNIKIQCELDTAKLNLQETETLISTQNDELIDVMGDIRICQNTINNVNESIDKLEMMEKKYVGYEHYLECVKRDGIPYKLISDVLPKLEIEVNNILSPIVDFQIIFNTDGKNINSYIAYGDMEYWPLELTSGMEKFISSVAIRTALINISNLPRPNFMAIDEGFGSLDNDKFNSLYLLFDYLKTQFDYILTISHIDKTRDMVDQFIDITKIGGFSSIRYL